MCREDDDRKRGDDGQCYRLTHRTQEEQRALHERLWRAHLQGGVEVRGGRDMFRVDMRSVAQARAESGPVFVLLAKHYVLFKGRGLANEVVKFERRKSRQGATQQQRML
jgi:hypothetical protein